MSENTPKRYHPIHVGLHWLMALLIFMMLGIGKFVMPGVDVTDPQKPMMLQSHSFIGMAIGILLLVRVVMLFVTKRPTPAEAGSPALNLLGKAVHILLYVFMFGMVASGLGMFQAANLPAVFSGASPYPTNLFDYPPRMGHGLSSWLLLALLALHVGAALFHQFIKKDNLMSRMGFGK